MSRLRDTVFWMPWPPPRWVWLLAGLVVLGAAGMMFASG
jgi:hypothetical protein